MCALHALMCATYRPPGQEEEAVGKESCVHNKYMQVLALIKGWRHGFVESSAAGVVMLGRLGRVTPWFPGILATGAVVREPVRSVSRVT